MSIETSAEGTPAASTAERVSGYSCYEATPAEALDLFEEARAKCPVPHSEKQGGFYLFLKYEDVKSAHADWRTFASGPAGAAADHAAPVVHADRV